METRKNQKVFEIRVLSIVDQFWGIMDSIENQNAKDNFLKNLFGTIEDIQKIRANKGGSFRSEKAR